MTKEMLKKYQSNKAEIQEIDWRLHNRWRDETLLCTDVILDYRTGYPRPQNITGFNYAKYDHDQQADAIRKALLEDEVEQVEKWVESIDEGIIRRIFRMVFLQGKTQKDVAKVVHLDQSRISRKIDEYLDKNA